MKVDRLKMQLQEATEVADDCSAEDDVRQLRLAMVELEQVPKKKKKHKNTLSSSLHINWLGRGF
jgi:hypothetical protein